MLSIGMAVRYLDEPTLRDIAVKQLSSARADIQSAVFELIGVEAQETYGHMTYREMARQPDLIDFRDSLLEAAEHDEFEQARERGEIVGEG